MPMETTSMPCSRTPRAKPRASSGLEVRWSRPTTTACAAGSRSSRYLPNPRPSASANAGVSSVAVRPRTSYSRNTCWGIAMARDCLAARVSSRRKCRLLDRTEAELLQISARLADGSHDYQRPRFGLDPLLHHVHDLLTRQRLRPVGQRLVEVERPAEHDEIGHGARHRVARLEL